MGKNKVLRGTLFIVLLGLTFLGSRAQAKAEQVRPSAGEIIPGQYIVLLADGVEPSSFARGYQLAPGHVYRAAVNGFAGVIPERRLEALRNDPRVALVAPNRRYRLEAQSLPTGVDRVEADLNPGWSGQAVDLDIAVFDTGIDIDHPDLNVAGGYNGTSSNRFDYDDWHGHGSHAAGVAAALDNGIGAVGIAPGARVWAIRVCWSLLGLAYCDADSMVAGMDMVVACKDVAQGRPGTCAIKDRFSGGDVSGGIDFAAANMSITTPDQPEPCGAPGTTPVHYALCALVNAGVPLSLSSGNEGNTRLAFPEAIAVSAIADSDGQGEGLGGPISCGDGYGPHADDVMANFSNTGSEIDIAAPGVCIYSTWKNGGYNIISGTSVAAPHVAGAIALYLHANGLPPASDAAGVDVIRQALQADALPKGVACSYTGTRGSEPLLFVNGPAFNGTGTIVPCSGGNLPPTAAAGPDQTVSDTDGGGFETVTLDGGGSTDDGAIVSYAWGEGGSEIATGQTASVDFAVGSHLVTLTVTDDGGATGSDTVLINVLANQPPAADAGSNQTLSDADGSGFETVTLDGGGSTDDGAIVSYAWSEAGSEIATGQTASVNFAVGSHLVTLTVTDDGGATGADTVVIDVLANEPPTAEAGPDQTVSDADGGGFETVTLDGGGSTDSDGSIVSYAWSEGGSEIATGQTAVVDFAVGSHLVTLTVTDDGGATGADTLLITVEEAPVETTPHVGDLAGASTSIKGEWIATAIITVHAPDHSLVAGVTVYGSWSGGTTGSGNCTTGADGSCQIDSALIPKKTASATFTAERIDDGANTYPVEAPPSHDPDGDSDGVSFVIPKDAAEPPPPPPPDPTGSTMHVESLTGSASTVGKKKWRADVIIVVHDENGIPVANAAVSGDWSDGGTSSCTTAGDGACQVSSSSYLIGVGAASTTFTVNGISHSSLAYELPNPAPNVAVAAPG